MKRVAILGATGSIGRQALEVIQRFPEELELVGVSGFRSISELKGVVERFRPRVVACGDPKAEKTIRPILPPSCELHSGEEGIVSLATREDVDLVLVAVVGIAGLVPTIEALKYGKTVALATKEAMVAGGRLIQEAWRCFPQGSKGNSPSAREYEDNLRGVGRPQGELSRQDEGQKKALGAIKREASGSRDGEQMGKSSSPPERLIPVDSEHSAIFQCLEGKRREDLRRIILTASGGPFLNRDPRQLERVTPEEAVAHPVWRMGKKISVDSATMMNKALEIIEAHFLFGLPPEKIRVVIHPQSIIHGMVEFADGSVQALLSVPDMRLPIQYALLYPRHKPSLVKPLVLEEVGALEFRRADFEKFPALELAYKALEMGGTAPAVLSAADEVAVELFLEGRISFTRIVPIVEEVLNRHRPKLGGTPEEVLEADLWARKLAKKLGTVPNFCPQFLRWQGR